ncbi:MAG: membrane protein insertion efficiency factor YidD [Candidatus Uhrbacteria bacterium]|nr:membrane protein insertion efficiency factor YidD [Candidatus Uhrbacteria bacterium]
MSFILGLIGLYQRLLSPDHSWISRFFPYGFCRFYPTCSRYAQASLKKYGIVRGGAMAVRRLLSCHPWHKGGIDFIK